MATRVVVTGSAVATYAKFSGPDVCPEKRRRLTEIPPQLHMRVPGSEHKRQATAGQEQAEQKSQLPDSNDSQEKSWVVIICKG